MKILLLGKSGQVGHALQYTLPSLGELVALDRHGDGQFTGDITDLLGIERLITEVKPDVLVNACAYTNVDQAEAARSQAWLINADAVGNLARICQQQDILLVHYSTDYVFDGQSDVAYIEEAPTGPLNYYGLSKLAGEQQIIDSTCNYLMFRTSWVYSVHGKNFIHSILNAAKNRSVLNVVNDQIGAPTHAALIAEVTARVIAVYQQHQQPTTLNGIYHLTATGSVSWFDYAQYCIEQVRRLGMMLQVEQIQPITTAKYPAVARRPLNSRLNTQKLQTTFQLALPHWQQGVDEVLQELRSA